ncbi:MAG: DUF6159 family protein [Dokdonella sp.]
MGRFARSWALVKASAAVLRSDRELLVFPLLSSICALLVAATFFLPLLFGGAFAQFHEGGQTPVWLWPLAFVFYLCQYFVIFFFNAALVGAARIRLDGGDPTLADGFRIASSHGLAILGYAAIAATAGLILRAIEERAGFIGRWIVGLLGVAWTVATFLTVPILVNENLGPIDAVKRSAQLLKKTWGENLVGNAGVGVVFGLVIVAWILLCAALVALAAQSGSTLAIGGVVAVGGLGVLLFGLLQSALQGVYAAALHRYAETGDAGFGFDGALVADAFKIKA